MGGATNPRGGRRAAIWGWPGASDELARSPARCRRPHGLARSDAAQGGKDALGRQIEQGPPLGAERVGQTSRPLRPDVADSEEHGWEVVGNTATVGGLAEILGQGRPNRPAASPRARVAVARRPFEDDGDLPVGLVGEESRFLSWAARYRGAVATLAGNAWCVSFDGT